MDSTTADETPTSKDVGATGTIRAEFLRPNHSLVIEELLEMEKHVAWAKGYALSSIAFKRQESSWLLVIKAVKGRKPYVAYVTSDTYPDSLALAAEFADKGQLSWQHDKWPTEDAKRRMALHRQKRS